MLFKETSSSGSKTVSEDISMQRQGKFTKVNGATISGMGRVNTP